MTALNMAGSFSFLDDPQVRQLVELAPAAILDGAKPRLLDEWNIAPDLWNLVRRAVDASMEPGLFILTGSALPADDVTRHTGAGRFLRLRERTMSWWEKLPPQNVHLSLKDLFDGGCPEAEMGHMSDLRAVIEALLQPGFPAMRNVDCDLAADRLRGYIDDVVRTDVPRLRSIRHEPTVLRQLITALSRSVSSEVSLATLVRDTRAVAPDIDPRTVREYLSLLERLFVVEEQLPWTPALRSRARVRTQPRFHLVDPALAAAALHADAAYLLRDVTTAGILFESAVVHDLTVLVSPLGGEVRFYRDSYGNELDAVVSLPDGRWGAVEVKLGGRQVEAGITSLNKTISQIDTQQVNLPSFRLVVTGTGPVFTADDGTVTAPLSALAP